MTSPETEPVSASDEPFYVRQTWVPSFEEARVWWAKCAEEAESLGATHKRAYARPDGIGRELLYEAWRSRPKDEGAPRWGLVKVSE